jgi:phosphoribosylanthranilate isomerase
VTTPRPPRIKICGLTGLDDAQRAVEAGAWALGLILFSGSPRRCPLPAAERISGALRRQAHICGVFVNAPLDEVSGVADALGLTMIQLHGDEGPSFCAEVARRTGAKVMKAARVRTGSSASTPTSTCSTPTSPGATAAPARRSTGSSCAGGGPTSRSCSAAG